MASLLNKLKSIAGKVVGAAKADAYAVASDVKKIVQKALPKPSTPPMVFGVGDGLSAEEKKRADQVIVKKVAEQKSQEAVAKERKALLPTPLRAVAKSVAPKTYEALHKVVKKDQPLLKRAMGVVETPVRAAQELFVGPAARTALGLAKDQNITKRIPILGNFAPEIAKTADVVARLPWNKELIGPEPLKSFSDVAKEGGEVTEKFSSALAKRKGYSPTTEKIISRLGQGAGMLAFGGLELSNLDAGVGSAGKKVLRETLEQGTKKLIQEGAERVARETVPKAVNGIDTILKTGLAKVDSIKSGNFFRGDLGKVTEHVKDFSKVIKVEGNQRKLLADMAAAGDEEAARVLTEAKSSLPNTFDDFIDNRLKDAGFDAVEYKDSFGKNTWREIRDVKSKQSFTDNADLAQTYALGRSPKRIDQAAPLLDEKIPRFEKTAKGYVFNGSGLEPSSPPSKGLLGEGIGRSQLPPPPTGAPLRETEATLTRITEKARQEALTRGEKYLGDPLEKIVDHPGFDVKTKVNALDYLRTPENVLKKIGLEKEATLLKQKYDDYLRELPIEMGKITEWFKRANVSESSVVDGGNTLIPAKGTNDDVSRRIFQYLDGTLETLPKNELEVALEIRTYLKGWAEKLNLPESSRIAHYITHIFDPDFIAKEFDPDLAKLITDKVPSSVYDPFLQKRLGAQGYKEDVWQALDAYTKRAVRKLNMDVALGPLEKAANKLDIDSYKYVEALAARVNLRPTAVDNLIDNLIKSSPVGYRLGQRPLSVISRKTRQATYRGTLSLNLGSALRNLTQGVNTYAELGEKYTLKGYINLVRSVKDGSKELLDVGILRDDFIQDRSYSATKKFWEKTDKGLFYFFEAAEKINRGSAYFGAKAKAIASGKTEEEAIAYAKKIVEKTQFRFGSVDTPVALQSDLAKIFTQFQSFNVKQTEFLVGKFQAKEWAGLIRYALGSAVVVASAGQLIGLEPKDMIPFSGVASGRTKLGETPLIKTIGTIMGALVNAPDAYGNERSVGKKLTDVGNTLIPFVPAGSQIKKVVGGINALREGGVDVTSSKRKGYEAIDTAGEKAKALLFGPYSIMGKEKKRLDEKDKILDAETKKKEEREPKAEPKLKGKEAGKFKEDLIKAKDNEDIKRSSTDNAAHALDDEFTSNKTLKPEDRLQKIKDLKASDPVAYDKFVKIVKEKAKVSKGGTPSSEEEQMKALGVESGARAQFINNYVDKLPKEERIPYIIELKNKGVVTSDVLRQMLKLKTEKKPVTNGSDLLGSLSSKYESSGDPGRIGYDNTGGWSYGTYQLAHSNAKSFIEQSAFKGNFKGLIFNTPAWRTKWGQVAKESPQEFGQAQHDFIARTHFEPQESRLSKLGVDIAALPKTVKDVIWSTAVQHGGNTNIVASAIKKVGDADPAKLVREIYKQRWNGGQNFARSTADVKKGVYNRFFGAKGEMALALKQLEKENV